MEDQGYQSKRQPAYYQPRRKRSHGQPPVRSTSPQAIDARFPQGYDIGSQPLDQVQVDCWGDYGAGTMNWESDASEKYGSISSPATTYINADTPSSAFTDHMGGYVMVKGPSSGAHCNGSGSNQTSGQASEEGPYYSPPFSPDGDFHLETGPMQQFHLAHIRNQKHVLSGLRTQNTRQTEQYPASGSSYQELPGNYTYRTSQTESFTQLTPQDQFLGPWNQTDLRVPSYDPGYVAFGLTPEPGPPEDASSLSRKSRPTQRQSSSRSAKLAPGSGRKDRSVSPGSENIVAKKGMFTFVAEGYSDPPPRTGRKGALKKETKKKAAAVRKLKACWKCWLLKVPCSEGETCQRCLKFSRCSKNTPFNPICSRFGFNHYEKSFFPDFLLNHLTNDAVRALISEHSNGFIDPAFEVGVTVGSAFPSMILEAHSFAPRERELCKQHHLTFESEEGISRLEVRFAAPVGIMMLSDGNLKKILGKYVECMVSNEQYVAQTMASESTDMPKLILDVAQQYSRTNDDSLVRNALKLHAMHYFMGTLITFADDSANDICGHFSHLHFFVPSEPFLSSRLLNRQLKCVMLRLQHEFTGQVLESLEKALRARTKDSWGPCFVAILVLCLCIESLQIAADTFVVCDRKDNGENSVYGREHSRAACEAVEECAFRNCTRLFHEIFKTSKISNSAARDGGFNPLRVLGEKRATGLDRKTEKMARRFHDYFDNASTLDNLQELARRTTLLEDGDVDPDAKDIKINNTGRLAAKFLMPFFVSEG